MAPTPRLALLAALALLATPLVTAQHGPPPGYTDPLLYTQDYAANQTGQAAADPAGYATAKATPEALAAEAEHAAWLACWTAYEADAAVATDEVCSQFFTAPVAVDPPQAGEAQAEVTETLNGTEALAGEVSDAVADTLEDPTSAVNQLQRIGDAVAGFLQGLVDGVLGLVDGLLDLLGLGGLVVADGFSAMVDGLLGLLQLPALGAKAALDGLGLGLGALGDGVSAAAGALADGALAAADGLAAAATGLAGALAAGASATADGLASGGDAVGDGVSSAVQAAGDGLSAIGGAIADGASAVGDAIAGLFQGGDDGSGEDGVQDIADGVETGTEADGLVDRVLDLL